MTFKRILLFPLLLGPVFCAAKRPTVRPPYLREGDSIGIVAPASRRPVAKVLADTAPIRARFGEWGLKVRFGEHLAEQAGHFAGTDAQRASDLQQMIDNPRIKAIFAYKGGYGSVRLLPLLDLKQLRHHPKWLVGFSDVTMLHMALGKLGVESIHGPMPASFRLEADSVDVSADSLRGALFGTLQRIDTPPHPLNQCGTACGTLAGGNLTLICSAIGTPEMIDTRRPTVLLIEDVGEAAYRIDRMMQQLLRSGMLRRIKAVLVGHFSRTEINDFDVQEAAEIIARYTQPLNIPVVFGFPAGHEEPNLPLYMGRRVHVSVSEAGASVEF